MTRESNNMSKQSNKIKQGSTQVYAKSLQHPVFKDSAREIQQICAMADRLHRTVSGPKAARIKKGFLTKLHKMIVKMNAGLLVVTPEDVTAVISNARKELARLDSTPAQNPRDWKVEEVVAQVKIKGRSTTRGGHEVSGGAPQ